MTTYFCDSSSSWICWYAWLMSSLVNNFPPASFVNKSSAVSSELVHVQTCAVGGACLQLRSDSFWHGSLRQNSKKFRWMLGPIRWSCAWDWQLRIYQCLYNGWGQSPLQDGWLPNQEASRSVEDEFRVSQIQKSKCTKVHGVMTKLLPMKLSASNKPAYFDGKLSNGAQEVWFMGFDSRYMTDCLIISRRCQLLCPIAKSKRRNICQS